MRPRHQRYTPFLTRREPIQPGRTSAAEVTATIGSNGVALEPGRSNDMEPCRRTSSAGVARNAQHTTAHTSQPLPTRGSEQPAAPDARREPSSRAQDHQRTAQCGYAAATRHDASDVRRQPLYSARIAAVRTAVKIAKTEKTLPSPRRCRIGAKRTPTAIVSSQLSHCQARYEMRGRT